MREMYHDLKMGPEPAFQILIIVSALLHVIVLTFVSSNVGLRNKAEDSYFVKLVMTPKEHKETKADIKKVEVVKQKEKVKVKPVKKKVKPKEKAELKTKEPVVSIKPKAIEKKSSNKKYAAREKPSKSVIPLAENKTAAGKKVAIKRRGKSSAQSKAGDVLKLDRSGRGSSFAAKKSSQLNSAITGKKVAALTETKDFAKGVREQSFAAMTDGADTDYAIKQINKAGEKEYSPVKKAVRDALFADSGQVVPSEEEQYEIARVMDQQDNIYPSDALDESEWDYPERDFANISETAPASHEEYVPSISRETEKSETDDNILRQVSPQRKQLPMNDEHADRKEADPDQDSSALSIQGVPLDDLNACVNALDERSMKKKILNIIGTRKECYNPVSGNFHFLGTSRFTSFDMKILPNKGRSLSNRCDELKNAYQCLTLK